MVLKKMHCKMDGLCTCNFLSQPALNSSERESDLEWSVAMMEYGNKQ